MTNKILLVDDEKDIVDLVEEVLQREGFQSIQKAFTGKEAVNLCRQFQPDVVVLDITLALLGVPLWWGGGYSVVNAFYCVTYNQNRIYGQDGRGGYSIAAVSRLFCYLIYFLFFVRTKKLKYLFYPFLHDFILFG